MCAGFEVAILGCVDLLYFASKLYYVNYSGDRMLGSHAGTMDQTPVKLKTPGNEDCGAPSGQPELLVAGLAQWVRFVRNRWQVKSFLCAWPITYEARDF